MKFSLISVFLIMVGVQLNAQTSPVVVRNHPESTDERAMVEVKWLMREIVHIGGTNVYRREVGQSNWVRVNDSPIEKKEDLSPTLIQEIPEAADFFYMADTLATMDINEVGFMMINVYALVVLYNQFAEDLGLFITDTNVQSGAIYEYKVALMEDGREFELGISKPIRAGSYQKEAPVTNFSVQQVKKIVELDWEVDESRFFSYNIFYSIKDSVENVRLNREPILPTLVTDSTGADVYPSPQFRFSQMEENYYYTFWAEGVDLFGSTSLASDSITFLFNDITPPEPATDFTGRVDSMKVILNWKPSISPDLKEHILYRSTQSDTLFQAIKTFTTETNYVDTVDIPGPYFYYIRAYDQAGNKRTSKIVYVNAGDVEPPAKPEGLTIVSDTGQLVLSWKANTEPDLLGYQIYRTVDSNEDSHYILVNGEPYDSTVFVQDLPKVVKNKFYYYVVALDTSFNRSERSDFAIGQMPDVLPPEQPFIKTISYQQDLIEIEWIQNVENDLLGYNIYRSDSTSQLNYAKVNASLIDRNTFKFADQSSEPNKGYLYYLEALDSAGNVSAPSLTAYAYHRVVKGDESLKLKANLKYNKRRKSNVISWQPLREEDLLGYVVFKAEQGKKLKPLTGLLQSASISDRNTIPTTVVYQVKAYTSEGKIIVSNEMSIQNKVGKK